MTSYFIVNFKASMANGVKNKYYSTMIFADTLQELSNTIVQLSNSYLEKEGYESVYIKVWKWEIEETHYMFSGVIYDSDPKTICI